MKKLIVLIMLFPVIAFGKLYIGAGPDYVMPQGDFSEVNDASIGLNLQVESRSYCKLWYGLRVDYINYEKIENLELDTDYYENGLFMTPQVRYVFLADRNYNNRILPYLQAGFTISSIGGTDEESRLGLGATAGAGVAFGFGALGTCWMLDLNARYFAPNVIYRSDNRPALNSFDVGLTLSLCL